MLLSSGARGSFSVLISSKILVFIMGFTKNPPLEKLICRSLGKISWILYNKIWEPLTYIFVTI
jgi:hypothetical protein